ncbi:MAG: alpha/beta fold hydrolase [Planctomycetes bacterium]|nr:alpha/beta fold hydrolase [Planctomycetota bacterium]
MLRSPGFRSLVYVFSLTALAIPAHAFAAKRVRFREHVVDRQSTYSAGAVFDVNRDGKLDLVTGGRWYEAPSWQPRELRQVEFINGRFDDYTCAPFDVNGDGWTDFLIANYRSRKLGWVENPGKADGPWPEHVVERPGPMETARLVDVDGDGRLDLFPNGRDFAAWWNIMPGGADRKAEFARYDLPTELVSHGNGAGDINRDGRQDLIGAEGWLEAPEDRRHGRWTWHPEFNLGPGASVPIVCADFDADGDLDLAWGRGHGIGLWWLEQTTVNNHRQWTPHAIDTSWSQPHTVEIADLDGDGKPELVTGKRYLGHDGNDLGEWDPLVIYYYQFLPQTRTWERFRIANVDSTAGFDVDPKLIDIDGDGDIDLFTSGRSGAYWFENLRIGDVHTAETPVVAATYTNHADLLQVRDDQGNMRPVKTPADWGVRRMHIKHQMETVMGPLPDPSRRVPLDVKIEAEQDGGKYRRIKLTYAAEPGDRVPAWLLIPKDLKKPAAAMLCLHQTNKRGKDSAAGLAERPAVQYAAHLAERGYVCLAPDYPSFGEYNYDFKNGSGKYYSGSMKAIWNNVRAIDLLETLPEVDVNKIGAVGHSLGGHNALFTAVFDLRLRAVITSCGFTAFPDYYGGKLAGWTSDRYMPAIRDKFELDPARMPFDFHEVLAAIAPRALFVNAPLHDSNFDVAGVRKVIASVEPVYELLGAKSRLVVEYPDAPHDFVDPVREQAYEWLETAFKKK